MLVCVLEDTRGEISVYVSCGNYSLRGRICATKWLSLEGTLEGHLLNQRALKPAAQDGQDGFQGGRGHNFPGQPVAVLSGPQCKESLLGVQKEPSAFQFAGTFSHNTGINTGIKFPDEKLHNCNLPTMS